MGLAHLRRSQRLTVLPAAEKRLCPEEETSRSCTTVSELEVPLPEGGLGGGGWTSRYGTAHTRISVSWYAHIGLKFVCSYRTLHSYMYMYMYV